MMQRLTGRKTLAMFVLAFLCLNVGGAFCLTYCTQLAQAASAVAASDAHLSEHCRKAKQAAEERNKDSSRVDAGEMSCCAMPVSLIAAPIEKRNDFSANLVVETTSPIVKFELSSPVISGNGSLVIPVYRPPPLDHSVDRILHCVIRI